MHQDRKFTANFPQLLTDEKRRLLVTLLTRLFHGVDTVSLNSAAMCTSVCPVSLLAVVVVAFVDICFIILA